MSVTDITDKVQEARNGVKVAYTFDFKIFQASDLEVSEIDNATLAVTPLALITDYTVAINNITEGGTVTYVSASSTGKDSFIKRVMPLTQQTDVDTEESIPSQSLNNEYDRSRMIDIQQDEELGRSIKFAETSSLVDIVYPESTSAANRALTLARWDAAGTSLEGVSAAAIVSAGGIPVITGVYRYAADASQVDQGVSTTGSIKALIDTIGSANESILLVPGTYTFSTDETIPSNVTLIPQPGAILSIDSGKTVTISGPIDAGLHQIFSGSGLVVFPAGYIEYAYPEWWGIDGVADEVQIYQAINALTEGTVVLNASYATAGTITLKRGVSLRGLGVDSTLITYNGSGYCISFGVGARGMTVSDMHIVLSDADGSAILIPDDCIRLMIKNIESNGNGGTGGYGVHLDNSAALGWIGGIEIINSYFLQSKYGIYFEGSGTGITMVSIKDTWIVGLSPGAGGPVAGSVGIHMNSTCNGNGTTATGLVIESMAIGIEHISGAASFGGRFEGTFESNTLDWDLGDSFNGVVHKSNSAKGIINRDTNGLVADFYHKETKTGVVIEEARTRFDYLLNGGTNQEFNIWRGNTFTDLEGGVSVVDAGRRRLFRAKSNGSLTTPQNNYIELLGHRVVWHTAAPTGGSWRIGDVIWDSTPVSGQPMGWVCGHSGTFGTATDATGDTDGATAVITGMADTSDFAVGDFVDPSAGFAATGPYEILAITSTTLTLDTVSNSVQSNITLDTSNPTFISMASYT